MQKLVRDLIPKIALEKSSENLEFYIASQEEFFSELKKKLQEEVNEFLAADDPFELADVLEVAYALANELGMTRDDLELARNSTLYNFGINSLALVDHKI